MNYMSLMWRRFIHLYYIYKRLYVKNKKNPVIRIRVS